MKIISWNIGQRAEPWRALLASGADLALLQEAAAPPPDVAGRLEPGPEAFQTAGAGCRRPWRAAVVRLSDAIDVEWLGTAPLGESVPPLLGVSRPGTLAAARVSAEGETLTVVSLYGLWERPHTTAGSGFIYADASVHRLSTAAEKPATGRRKSLPARAS